MTNLKDVILNKICCSSSYSVSISSKFDVFHCQSSCLDNAFFTSKHFSQFLDLRDQILIRPSRSKVWFELRSFWQQQQLRRGDLNGARRRQRRFRKFCAREEENLLEFWTRLWQVSSSELRQNMLKLFQTAPITTIFAKSINLGLSVFCNSEIWSSKRSKGNKTQDAEHVEI